MKPVTVALVLFLALVLASDAFILRTYLCAEHFALKLGHTCVEDAFSGDYKSFQYHYGYERRYYKKGFMSPKMTMEEKLIEVYTPRKPHFCPSWSEMESDCCQGNECSKERFLDLCNQCFSIKWIKN